MSSIDRDWSRLPDIALDDVMLMVGLESLESLHRCRQVCRMWNEKIMTNIWGNKKKKRIITAKIEIKFNSEYGGDTFPSNEEISHVKWLGTFSNISLFNVA